MLNEKKSKRGTVIALLCALALLALVILLEKAGIIKNYFSPYERGQMKDRLKAIVRSPQGRQVGRMVEYVEGMLSIMTVLMVMYQ